MSVASLNPSDGTDNQKLDIDHHEPSKFRQHPPQDNANHFRLMFPGRTFQRIRALEAVGACNLHLPTVVSLGSNNRKPPIAEPIGKHVFDDRANLCLQSRTSRVLHLHRNCHTAENITVFPDAANPVTPCRGFL
jgi:hypothetical protein